MRARWILPVIVGLGLVVSGCGNAPPAAAEREEAVLAATGQPASGDVDCGPVSGEGATLDAVA